jgi:hypothetical protein
LFAPSKAATWANCAGALALADYLKIADDAPSEHAASGTLTHKIGEALLRACAGEIRSEAVASVFAIGTTHQVDGFTLVVDAARLERAGAYANAVRERGGIQAYEVKMDFSPVIGIADQFGTSDAVTIQLEQSALEAHDLKDGNRIVSAKENDQVISYLAMARRKYEDEYLTEFQVFRGFIHQPKVDWQSDTEITRAELSEHEARLRDAAARAQALIGESLPKIKAALTPGDKQCEWCPCRRQCSARRTTVVNMFPGIKVAKETLTEQEIGELLTRRTAIEAFFSDLAGEALARAKAGTTIPGFKLVEGRAGNRKWIGDVSDALYEALEQKAWEKTLISPTTAEKLMKKTHPTEWAALQPSIERAPGPLTLVSDASAKQPTPLNVPEFENIVASGSDLVGAI